MKGVRLDAFSFRDRGTNVSDQEESCADLDLSGNTVFDFRHCILCKAAGRY